MIKIKELGSGPHYYHEGHKYYGDPTDDTTWEPGEQYEYDEVIGKYYQVPIELPYTPLFVTTDEEWLKNRIFAYAEENPLMCDICNRYNCLRDEEGNTVREYSRVMIASIPKGMVWLLRED